jgi:PST family polysaccharide transporter
MNNRDFDPPHKEMGRHIKSGILNSGAVQIIKVFCQFASVVILSRLLPPSDFGILAMAGPVYAFVTLFLDLGLNQATVQKTSLTHEEANAFFWINVGVGAALTVMLAALSPLAGWYYGDERVTSLTAAMAVLVMISAFGNQHAAILLRRMAFRASSLIDIAGTLGSLLVSVGFALVLKTYWALYFGMVAAVIIPVIGAWIAARWKPTAPRFPSHIAGSMKFGVGITSFNITNFFARNMDNILIGRYYGGFTLGLYDRAYKLLLFPLQRIVYPVSGIMIPVLSRMLEEPEKYRQMFLKILGQLILITWPGILWAILFSHELITTLLGDKWKDTVDIFRPLAVAALIQMVNSPSGPLYISQGRSGDYARWGIVSGVTSVLSFVIGLPFGAVGVAIAYAISEYVRTPFLWLYATRQGPVKAADIVTTALPQFGAAAVTTLVLLAFNHIHLLSGLPLLLVAGFVSYFIFALAMFMLPNGRITMRQTLTMGLQIILRTKSEKS